MEKGLAIGGTGYLGRHVIKALKNEGYQLICIIRRNSDTVKFEEINLDDTDNHIAFINNELSEITEFLQKNDIDFVINMACNYGKDGQPYCDDMIDANVNFMVKVMDRAVKHGVKRFYNIGTSLPSKTNMYSFTKRICAEYGEFYSTQYDIDFIQIALEMYYGANEPEDRFIPGLINKMIKGEEINTTEGTQRRDIISINDVISAIIAIINSKLNGYQEIPVGTGKAPTVREIVEYIYNETGMKSLLHIGAVPMRKNEPDCIADTTVLQKIMKNENGWNPLDWKDGIKKLINEKQQKDKEK